MTLIDEIFDLQIPGSVQISPNAQQVIYTTTYSGHHKKEDNPVSTIWLAETGKPRSARQLTPGTYNDTSPKWRPDGSSIAFISDRAKHDESSAIYILPVTEAGEAYAVTPADHEKSITSIKWSPSGDCIAYLSADETTEENRAKDKAKDDVVVWNEGWEFNRLRIVSVATKEITTLVARDAHVCEFDWNDDGTKIAFAETRTPNLESPWRDGSKISVLDVSTKAITDVCTFPNTVEHLTWAGDALYFTGRVRPSSCVTSDMVYQIGLSAGTMRYEQHAHGQGDCADDLIKVGKQLVVLVAHGVESHIRFPNDRILLNRKQRIDSWDAATVEDGDEMMIALTLSGADAPPEVFTANALGGAMVQLSTHGELLKDHKFGNCTFLTCQSTSVKGDQSVRLDGLFVIPSSSAQRNGKPMKPLATVVMPHGGPYGRNTEEFSNLSDMWTPLLLNAGYAVLYVNYRGSRGRGEDFAAACRGAVGTYDLADVVEVTQHAIAEGYADKQRLIIGGWSQGGFLSYLASVRNGQHQYGWKFKGAMPGAGVTDWGTMALSSDAGYFEAELAGIAPWESEDKREMGGRANSPIWEFAAARKRGDIPPLLMMHGERDERCPVNQAMGFRRALEAAGLPFEFAMYPREPHDITERKHLVDLAERMLKFVEKHIGGS